MTKSSFTVDVEPIGFDGINPKYKVGIYQFREAGICGPYMSDEIVVGLDGVDELIREKGFERIGEYGEVCQNGYVCALLVKKVAA